MQEPDTIHAPIMQLGVARVGLAQQRLALAQADDRVVGGIDEVDPRERRLHHLAARDGALANRPGKTVRGDVEDLHPRFLKKPPGARQARQQPETSLPVRISR